LSIVDQNGSQVQAVSLGQDVWPGTDALNFVEVEAVAPSTAGDHRWQVKAGAWNLELPHGDEAVAITLRVVDAPDCEVTVEVFDREKQVPIADALVVMHPYRGITGKTGVAKLAVIKGRYDILVSGTQYIPASNPTEVTADMTVRVELDEDPPWESPD
jgi:hypothetical protein